MFPSFVFLFKTDKTNAIKQSFRIWEILDRGFQLIRPSEDVLASAGVIFEDLASGLDWGHSIEGFQKWGVEAALLKRPYLNHKPNRTSIKGATTSTQSSTNIHLPM